MRAETFRKILYLIVSLFLLCNFFSASPEYQTDSFSYENQKAISISVPNGIQLEIKAEKNSFSQIEETFKINASIRSYSSLKIFLLFAAVLCIKCAYYLYFFDAKRFSNTTSQLFILNYIHREDGKKRQ